MRTEVKVNNSETLIVKDSLTLNSRISERVSTASLDIIGEEYRLPSTKNILGDALSFNGTSDFASIPDNAILDDIRTFEAWINPLAEVSHTTTSHILVTKHSTFRHGIVVAYILSPNLFGVQFYDGTTASSVTWTIPKYNVWYHVVGMFDTDMRAKLYINGNYIGQGVAITGHSGNNDQPVRIGGGVTGRYSNVIIDEIRCYNRPLAAQEIAYSYNGGNGQVEPLSKDGLVGWWKLDEGSGVNLADGSGNGNNGTISSATWVEGISPKRIFKAPSLAITFSPSLGGNTRVHTRDDIQINRGSTPFQNASIVLFPAMGGESTYLNKFFGGYVASAERKFIKNRVIYSCQCHDYNSRLNSILVNKTYNNKTEQEIINDLFGTYWTEINTIEYVDGTNNVSSIQFPDIYLSEALEMLARLFDKEFYIDYDRKLHYFKPAVGEAPFILSDRYSLTTRLPRRIIKWKEDAIRLISRVKVKGDESIPIEVIRTDSNSYAKYGEWFDYVHIDRNINTEAWANLVGDSILAESAFEKIRGQVRLWQEGLVVGQKVYIEDLKRNIDGYYLIQALQLRMIAPYQEEVTIDVGDYSLDLVGLLKKIDQLERAK